MPVKIKYTKDQFGNPCEPTPEELAGETYEACYGASFQPVHVPKESDEHSQ